MSNAIQEPFEIGEDPTPEQLELFEWAEEAIRKEAANVADSLRQLTTIIVALLGGVAAFAGQLPTAPALKVLAFAVLLAALAVALWGGIPRTNMMSPNYLRTVEPARQKITHLKTWCLKTAGGLLFAAFAVLLVGMLWQITGPSPVKDRPAAPPAGTPAKP